MNPVLSSINKKRADASRTNTRTEKRKKWKRKRRLSSERRVTESRKSVHTVHYCSALSLSDRLEGKAGMRERGKLG